MPSTKTNLGTETRRVVVLGIVLVVLSITGAVLAVFYRGGPARQAKVNEAATPYEDIDSDEKLQQWDPDQPRKSKPRPLRHTARSAKDGSRKRPAGPAARAGVTVTIRSAEIGRPRLVLGSGRHARPKKEYLKLVLRLENTSDRKTREYTSWATRAGDVRLADDLQNRYRMKSFRGVRIEGQLKRESIGPKESIEDVLIFDKPVAKARSLRLRLPALAYGDKGTLTLRIPVSDIRTAAAKPPAWKPPTPPLREQQSRRDAEPEDDISKINRDIEALGGGDKENADNKELPEMEEMLRKGPNKSP
jgi:hypothetical protein